MTAARVHSDAALDGQIVVNRIHLLSRDHQNFDIPSSAEYVYADFLLVPDQS